MELLVVSLSITVFNWAIPPFPAKVLWLAGKASSREWKSLVCKIVSDFLGDFAQINSGAMSDAAPRANEFLRNVLLF